MKVMASHRNRADEDEATPIFDYMQEELRLPCPDDVVSCIEKALTPGWEAWEMNYDDDAVWPKEELERLEEG